MANLELFQGDIALISGANKGIGYEIARGLGAKKITVLVGRGMNRAARRPPEKLKAEGADARFIKLDVTNSGTIRRAADWIEKEFGRLDILMNNAGSANGERSRATRTLAKVREIYETNFFGPMALIQAMLPLLRRIRSTGAW